MARPRLIDTLDFAEMETRIAAWYARATDEDREQGRTWYARAGRFARRLSDRHGASHRGTVAVLAILSPRIQWTVAMRYAAVALAGGTPNHFPAIRAKVQDALIADAIGDDPMQHARGPKVSSFARLLADPRHGWEVCIDTHAAAIALGPLGEPMRVLGWVGGYQAIQDAYRAVALRHGLRPSVLQAVTWVTYRREVYKLREDF